MFIILLLLLRYEYRKKRARTLMLKHGRVHNLIKGLTPEAFEVWVQGLFINAGAEAVLSKREAKTGFDHGIDVEVKYKGKRFCVQCKKYGKWRNVDETVVRDMYGVKSYGGYDKVFIFTTSRFSSRAVDWASKKKDIVLINGALLQQLRDNRGLFIKMMEQ